MPFEVGALSQARNRALYLRWRLSALEDISRLSLTTRQLESTLNILKRDEMSNLVTTDCRSYCRDVQRSAAFSVIFGFSVADHITGKSSQNQSNSVWRSH